MPEARTAFAKLLASPWKFNQHGQSGLWISELFPELAKQADELCLLRGMHTDVPAHPQAFLQMHTGIFQFKRPSMGAWTLYGLGTREREPARLHHHQPAAAERRPGQLRQRLPAGRLPGHADPRRLRRRPRQGPRPVRRQARQQHQEPQPIARTPSATQLDFIQSLNRETLEREPHDAGVEGAIESFELAFRMQKDMPKVMDLSSETEATKALYGIGDQTTENFGRQCLLARRFVEAGVRFVEITSGQWDHHRDLKNLLGKKAHERR